MNREQIYSQLTQIFKDVFDDEKITLRDEMAAKDLPQWDSLNHINLIVSAEKRFRIHFSTAEVIGMANVGEFVGLIAAKLAAADPV